MLFEKFFCYLNIQIVILTMLFTSEEGYSFVSVVDRLTVPKQNFKKEPNHHEFRAWLKMSSFSSEEEKKEDSSTRISYWESGMPGDLGFEAFKRRRPRMIVFDKDGTLGDDAASLGRWMDHMTTCLTESLKENTELSESQISEIVHRIHNQLGWDNSTSQVFPSAPLAAGTWEESVDKFCDLAEKCGLSRDLPRDWHSELKNVHGSDPAVIPNLQGMIQSCRELGLLVAVCTSDDRVPTNNSLRNWKINDMIDLSICGDEVATPKPSALPLEILCQKASVQPQDCIVVGDTTGDTGMARNAKAGLCIGVLSGSGVTDQLIETGADIVVPNVGHIPELLDRIGVRFSFDSLQRQEKLARGIENNGK